MGKFAVGKDAYGISDRSGFRYRLRDMRQEWNGLLVGKDEWEAKHPQLEVLRHLPDPEALRNPRPDSRAEPTVERLLPLNPFRSGDAGSSVITVFEPSHGRSTLDFVVFRKTQAFDGFTKTILERAEGYTITVIDVNSYTFTAIGGAASIGGVIGGGGVATADTGSGVASTTAELVSQFTMTANGIILSASTFDSISVTFDSASKTFDEA